MATIFDAIKKDHQEFKNLFSKLVEATSYTKSVARDYEKLHRDLFAHVEAEERTLYQALMDTDARPLALDALEEHRTVRGKLLELDGMSDDDERCIPVLKVAQALVEHHIGVEEKHIIPKALRLFDDEQIKQLTREFSELRKEAMAHA